MIQHKPIFFFGSVTKMKKKKINCPIFTRTLHTHKKKTQPNPGVLCNTGKPVYSPGSAVFLHRNQGKVFFFLHKINPDEARPPTPTEKEAFPTLSLTRRWGAKPVPLPRDSWTLSPPFVSLKKQVNTLHILGEICQEFIRMDYKPGSLQKPSI